MEPDTMPSQMMNCPIPSVLTLKVDLKVEHETEFVSCCEDKKPMDLYLKYDGDESISNGKFIESSPIETIKNEKKFDQTEFDLYLEDSSDVKWKTRTFEKKEVESNDKNMDKKFDIDIKKETNDVDEVETEELNYGYARSFKWEIIEQDELHIEHEDDKQNDKDINKEFNNDVKVVMECGASKKKSNTGKATADELTQKSGNNLMLHECPECPYKTCRKPDLKRHAEIHNKSILKCSKCCYQTLRLSNLKRHQKIHSTDIQWLHCPDPECSFKTHQRYLLGTHVLAHKSDAFKCPNCPYQTRRKSRLAVHQVMHESRDNWHSCPLCPYKTYDKFVLKSHRLRRHSTDPNSSRQIEIFKCSECPYESVYKQNVKIHKLVHDQDSWFQCSDCVYKTPYKNIFKKHQVLHQGENGKGWYRCLECSYKTPCKHKLRLHFISHKSAEEIRWFECSQCSFKTAHKYYLKRHQLKHKQGQEVEWFCCYECSFKTKIKGSLARHVSKHKKQIDIGCLQNCRK